MEMTNNGDKPRGIVRRLAWEATIFAVLGMEVNTIGVFFNLDMKDPRRCEEAVQIVAGTI